MLSDNRTTVKQKLCKKYYWNMNGIFIYFQVFICILQLAIKNILNISIMLSIYIYKFSKTTSMIIDYNYEINIVSFLKCNFKQGFMKWFGMEEFNFFLAFTYKHHCLLKCYVHISIFRKEFLRYEYGVVSRPPSTTPYPLTIKCVICAQYYLHSTVTNSQGADQCLNLILGPFFMCDTKCGYYANNPTEFNWIQSIFVLTLIIFSLIVNLTFSLIVNFTYFLSRTLKSFDFLIHTEFLMDCKVLPSVVRILNC